jgi:hypothetical protein
MMKFLRRYTFVVNTLQSGPHLLASVFVTPLGLGAQKYKLGHFEKPTEFFRIERYLSSLHSLKDIEWGSVHIYLGLARQWEKLFEEVRTATLEIFPSAIVESGNLRNRLDWWTAAKNFDDESLVYLHSNDDHFLMPGADKEFNRIVDVMSKSGAKLAHLTHFPEFRAQLATSSVSLPSGVRGISITMPIGTMLIRADFFKSWWTHGGQFDDDHLIVRPDNPFGESVKFDPEVALVGSAEVLRHMDGYAHVFLSRPLTPLPNTVEFQPNSSPNCQVSELKLGLWPAPLGAFSKKANAVAAHLTSGDDFMSASRYGQFRLAVARYQAAWGLKIDLSSFREIHLAQKPLYFFPSLFGALVALTTWPVARNIPDLILTPLLMRLLRNLEGLWPKLWFVRNMIAGIGAGRTVLKYSLLATDRYLKRPSS